MPFYPLDAAVPLGFRTEEFVLEPLGPEHNPLDYDAVMASRVMLNKRGQGGWPRDGFTPEENLADLERHAADFQARTGFTYTVLQPDRRRCLGCVYLYPLFESLSRREGAQELIAQTGEDVPYLWFWTRPDAPAGMDERLVDELIPWIRSEFAFPRLVAFTWASAARQVELLEGAGLRVTWSFPQFGSQALYFE